MSPGLAPFHPLIRDWFESQLGRPTRVQEEAWPAIAKGSHVLATAPTGSGKTLTAFLWAVNQLAAGAWETGSCRVLYISPLKALNNDIRENLIQPLAAIQQRFQDNGLAFPHIRVLTRSGDTPQRERRKMSLHPPEILITTPESLNLLLSSKSGINILGRLKTVILDEIHACAGTKRGVHLITGVDRLVRLSGEFQRIALSATLKDLTPVEKMIQGYRLSGSVHDPVYHPRSVSRIQPRMEKAKDLRICFPQRPDPLDDKENEQDPAEEKQRPDPGDPEFSVWDLLADEFLPRLNQNRSTLIFSNGRRLCEKLAYKVNQAAGSLMAYSHHGSLSKELRQDVEKKLKKGDLKAIVSTASLEMGIDIGALDEVIMVQSPPSVSSAIQRMGRAGHQVGQASKARIYPAHVQDLIPSAVLARAVMEGDIEPLDPVSCPLDVLAQILISMTGCETWDMDELFAFIRTSSPFHDLDRTRFDLVINMLGGSYTQTRIRELRPRVCIDRLDNTVTAAKGALLALYMSGGTIPDRGYYKLRHAQTRAVIGELDEEYVWEAKKGQIATVGSQNWKITQITHNDVFALPAGNRGMDAPFWIAEGMNRDFHFSGRMGDFLEMMETALKEKGGKKGREKLTQTLESDYAMDENGALELIRFCQEQMARAALPHRHHLVLEYVRSGPDSSPGTMLVIHTLWGGRVNRPFALALEGAWQEAFNEKAEVFPGNDAVVIQLPLGGEPEAVMALVTPDNLERLVRKQLESSGFFGARFRECAGRALLVTRNRINQRMPLWMTRLHSQRLMENILNFPDFPILLETWRTCLKDEFDMDALIQVLQEIEQGNITWSAVYTTTPSPFARAMSWEQINQYMYQEDQPPSKASALKTDLIQEALYNEALRPQIPKEVIKRFETKRQRLATGYAPQTPMELLDWVRERKAIPLPQWEGLIEGLTRKDLGEIYDGEGELAGIRDKLALIRPNQADHALVIALESAPGIKTAWYSDRLDIQNMEGHPISDAALDRIQDQVSDSIKEDEDLPLGLLFFIQWLGFYGPLSQESCISLLGLTPEQVGGYISELEQSRQIITGTLVLDEDEPLFCDAGNFEILIRMNRAAARPEFKAMDIEHLPFFLAGFQGVGRPGHKETMDHLFQIFEQLSCLPVKADLWETQILPARVQPYYPAFLDSLMQEGELIWLGREKKEVLFCLEPDLEFLVQDLPEDDPEEKESLMDLCFKTPGKRVDMNTLFSLTQSGPGKLAQEIWEKVWQGRISNDGFMALRKWLETGISQGAGKKVKPHQERGWEKVSGLGRQQPRGFSRGRDLSRQRSRGSGYGRSGKRPGVSHTSQDLLKGNWFRPDMNRAGEMDLVEEDALGREKVRLLLDRYGILFKELLARELPGFRWGHIFRFLYLMELSGEVVAGVFFKKIQGPQFASHRALRQLKAGIGKGESPVFWVNAMDPASACGLGPLSHRLDLPRRLPGNLMVYKGSQLKLVSLRQGRELIIHAPVDDPCMPEYISALASLMTRQYKPLSRISVATINGEDAAASPYCPCFEGSFETAAGHRTLDLFQPL